MALWLAAALFMALPELHNVFAPVLVPTPNDVFLPPTLHVGPLPMSRDPMLLLRTIASLAILWAGLELMAALPLSRLPRTSPVPRARSDRGSRCCR